MERGEIVRESCQQAGWSGLGGLTLGVQAAAQHLQHRPDREEGEAVAQPGPDDGLPGLVSLSHRSEPCQVVQLRILSFTGNIFHIIENMTSRVSKV